MSSLDKQSDPLRAPADKGGGSSKEAWPADIPEYCKGVGVHLDEPYYSFGDGTGKLLSIYSSPIDGYDEISNHNLIDAALYWLEKSRNFYKDHTVIVDGLSALKPLLEDLKGKMVRKEYEGAKELVDSIRDADDALDKSFQMETGRLLSSTAVALFPLLGKGLNRKILDIIIEPVSKEKAAGLLDLLANHEAGQLDDAGLKTGVETLFAEELK